MSLYDTRFQRRLIMKKFFIILLTVAMIITSLSFATHAEETSEEEPKTIFLGRYEQDENAYTGEEAIEWWILDKDGDRMLLVSLFALDVQPYDDEKDSTISWEKSYIRNWLNNDFYNSAFTEEEKKAILTTTIINAASEGNPEWEVSSTPDTDDKVFLLSASEYYHYFSKEDKCYYTPYAQTLSKMILRETGSWLLRSPGKKAGEYSVAEGGKVKSIASNKAVGICPAIWIDTSIELSDFPYEQYLKAWKLYDSEQYTEAASLFDELGGYNGSYFDSAECLYDYGYSIIDSTDYEEIIRRFEAHKTYGLEKIDDYIADTDDIINKAYYDMAVVEQSNGNFNKAIELYTRLGQYQDSMKRLKDCYSSTSINWENIISKGVNVIPQREGKAFVLKYSFNKPNDFVSSDEFNATNVGYGLSYALPIIVALLTASANSLIIIENPEIHLHPHGQSELAKLIARTAQTGVQIIVETHSDHIINGILVATKQFESEGKGVDRNRVQLFNCKKNDDVQTAEVTPINIIGDGKIDVQPEGFFDQTEKDLSYLLGF